MIILLVLLPALVLSEEVSKIDLTKCTREDNLCYCSLDDIEFTDYQYVVTTDAQGNTQDNLIELQDKCTKIGLQHQFFNENHALFQIQAKLENGEQLAEGATLELYQGTKLLFGCKLEKGKVELVETSENKDFVRTYKISLFEDRSIMNNNIVLCSVQSKKVKNIKKDIEDNAVTNVKLSWNGKIYKDRTAKNDFFKARDNEKTIKCDPYSFKDLPNSKEYIFHSLRNRDADVMNCDNYNVNTDLFTMRYQKISDPSEDHEIKQLKCEYKNYDFYYVPGKVDPADDAQIVDMEEITDPESYRFYCAAHFDELCETPIKGCTDTETNKCPDFTAGKKVKEGAERKPSTLKCTDNRWLINNEYYELEVSCMKNIYGDTNTAIFFAKLPSGRYIPVPKDAKCFTQYDCRLKSKLELPTEGTSGPEGMADDSDGILKCKDPERTLTIFNLDLNKTLNTSTSYKCDPVTGSWMDGAEEVPSNSRVRCEGGYVAPTREIVVANMTEMQVIFLIIGGAVGIIIIIIIIGVAYYFISKNKHKLKFSKLTKMKLTKSELIADCKNDFITFQQATPSNDHLIVEAFKKIDSMLQLEIGHPEAWEEAYKFLQRFHGSIYKIDWPIKHMFSRYVYLQAKKIIDKHGWKTKTKIRNKKRDGLMRAVALHLLTYCWDDYTSEETDEFLVDAFRELGFKGLSQYPHCGFLWSIITYAKPTTYEHATEKRRTTFSPHTFMEHLKGIVGSEAQWYIAPEDVIPTFGTVSQQAAFALGASPNLTFVTNDAKEIMTTPNTSLELKKSFFEGMYESIIRNPSLPILEGFNMIFKTDPEKRKKDKDGNIIPVMIELLLKLAPRGEWLEQVKEAARISTYYGRFIDAKRLYERFSPDGPYPDFLKMQLEQKLFEDAVEKGLEDIRAWFAAHTDKAEFKKKPDYSKVPKLDILVGEFVPPKGCGTPAQSKSETDVKASGSKSSGGSDSKNSDGKSPAVAPPPSDPNAAAPATTPAAPGSDPTAAPAVNPAAAPAANPAATPAANPAAAPAANPAATPAAPAAGPAKP